MSHIKSDRWTTNLRIDKIEVRVVINYLQKKGMKPKVIYKDIVQILAEDSLSYVMMKWIA